MAALKVVQKYIFEADYTALVRVAEVTTVTRAAEGARLCAAANVMHFETSNS